jgi:hypothetical protein
MAMIDKHHGKDADDDHDPSRSPTYCGPRRWSRPIEKGLPKRRRADKGTNGILGR